MSARPSPEFKVAFQSAKAAYEHDQKVDTGDAPEIAGILVLQQPGLPRRPFIAVFADFYKYQSQDELKGLGRFVERFFPGGDYENSAQMLKGIWKEVPSWASILLDENIPTSRNGFSPEVKVFPKPEKRDVYDSLDSELKGLINSAAVRKAVGKVDPVVYMTDPAYRTRLASYYADSREAQNNWLMDAVTIADYQRWTAKSGPSKRKVERELATWRSLKGKFEDRADGGIGSNDYGLAKFDLYHELESIQPDQVEEVARGLAGGETYEGFTYTPALELAISSWDQLDPSDKRTILQWTRHYQPISPSDLVDRMAAPTEIRDQLMRQKMARVGRTLRSGLYIATAELARQMFVAGLR